MYPFSINSLRLCLTLLALVSIVEAITLMLVPTFSLSCLHTVDHGKVIEIINGKVSMNKMEKVELYVFVPCNRLRIVLVKVAFVESDAFSIIFEVLIMFFLFLSMFFARVNYF